MKKAEVIVRIKRKDGTEDIPLPAYLSPGASGMDLYAEVESDFFLSPGEIRLVSCGIYVSIPPGYEGEIRPRSGLALKHGIGIVNSPGTVDSDYRGLVGVILINLGKKPYPIKRGARIAQMVIRKVTRAELKVVEELDSTLRGEGGFGHTGS